MSKPFASPGTPSQFLPDRPMAVQHIRLDVSLDFAERSIAGRAALTLAVRASEVTAFVLDAVDMDVRAVTLDGQPAPGWHYDGRELRVRVGRALRRGERVTVAVDYLARPRRGLYFVGPTPEAPSRAWHCWTQGQDEDARYVFPCIDAPIEKSTSEVICSAPRGLVVLSNGDLVEHVDLDAERERWHYRLEAPQASYLVTLVCGPFTEIRDRAPETGVDVHYLVPPGREADGRRALGKTPAMIDFFSRRIGVRYPHRRYSQIVVSEFIFGGMENTTATTLTDQALLDERAALDHEVEYLVAHELAHQWWGNLLTCREWPEAWLNEGFATYFEYVWREHEHGRDEADLELRQDLDAYLSEAGSYERPIVCRQYEAPIEIFDAHLYDKGGRVLHMVRLEVGDQTFFDALRLYAERHAHGSVETRDLARALEEISGRNFDRFFEQWVQTPSHPDLECGWEWDDERKLGTLRVKQTQQPDDRTYAFSAVVAFEVDGQHVEHKVAIRDRAHAFEIPLAARPTQVVFDPGDGLLKTVKFEKGRALWTRQLEAARLGIDRVLAARALGDMPEPQVVSALRRALESDAFWGVRAAAAAALGHTRRTDALAALLAARGQPHPKVRRAVAAALGEFRHDEEAAQALERWLREGDASGFVEAAAALSLGKTKSPRATVLLPNVLERPFFGDQIRARALEGLGESGALDEALPILVRHYDLSFPAQTRRAAIVAAGHLAEGTPAARQAREVAERALLDPDFRVRMTAAGVLSSLGDARSAESIERALAAELDGRARRRMRQAAAELRDGARPGEEARRLRDEVDRLRGELGKLRERLEVIEAARVPSPVEPRAARPAAAGASKRPPRPRPPGRRTGKTTRRRR